MSSPIIAIPPRRSIAWFAILSILMVIFSYLFVLTLAVTCVYLPYLAVMNSEVVGSQLALLFLFGVVIAAVMVWSLLPRPDKFKPPGLRLDAATQPRLFREIEYIAAALSEPIPAEVYLIGDANAFVADRGGFLGFGSRRVMGLGLPLLSILSVSQFRAVLAHEFAHYYGGDTSLGPWVYKTQSAIVRIFQNIGSVGKLARIAILGVMYLVVAALMKWYFKLFLRAIKLASRQREYRADELACMIAGPQPLIDGLRAIHAANMTWPVYWKTELSPAISNGALPGIAEGFARFVAIPNIYDQIQKGIETQIQDAKSNPYDSHPCLRDRIDAARKLSGDLNIGCGLHEDSSPARTLLDHLTATELRFVEDANPQIKPGSLKCISWEEVGSLVVVPVWKKFASEYSTFLAGVTVESLPLQVPNLPRIGSNIRDPEGMLLDPAQRTRRAAHLFATGLALVLLDRGWTLHTNPGYFYLRSPGQASLEPFVLMNTLLAGKLSADEWVVRCRSLGIADLPLAPAAPQQPVPANP